MSYQRNNQSYQRNDRSYQRNDQNDRQRNPIFLPLKDYQSIKVPREPVTIQEDYLLVEEVIPNQVYEFNLGETRFRRILQKQKDVSVDHQPAILDLYYLYHYVVCFMSDRKSYSYQEELQSAEWIPEKKRYRQVIRRQYFPPNSHDLDSYLKYHLVVRVIRFQVKNRVFEIIIPREKDQAPFETSQNLWLKLRSDCELVFPAGTTFVIKESKDI